MFCVITEIMTENHEEFGTKTCEPHLHVYSTKELEALRFANIKEQQRQWEKVYRSFEAEIAKEYDGLQALNNQKKKKQQKKKNKNVAPKITGLSLLNIFLLILGVICALEGSELICCRTIFEVLHGGNCAQIEEMGLQLDSIQGSVQSVPVFVEDGVSEIQALSARSYSKSEMMALRFTNVEHQQRMWKEVYHKLSSDVEVFDGLWVANNGKQQHSGNVSRQQSPEKNEGETSVVNTTSDTDQLVSGDTLVRNGNETDIEELPEEYDSVNDEDDSSSDEYESIQRPAFFVEGEPDFASGPPLDGLEYLRRVRWEAAKIPKVKMVKLNARKRSNEQTPYMPNIPEIPKCPLNLLPSEAWEKAFLADFLELRQAISELDDTRNQSSLTDPPCKQSDYIQHLKNKNQDPALSTILAMDAVSRAATLRNTIRDLETASSLSRNDCIWLYSLCAAVDMPLHGGTCASLRCLLRKCSGLLALKAERDEEVAMLSILITISGKFFGQLESSH